MGGNKIKTGDFPSGLCVVKAYKNAAYTQEYLIDFIGSKYAYNEAFIKLQIYLSHFFIKN